MPALYAPADKEDLRGTMTQPTWCRDVLAYIKYPVLKSRLVKRLKVKVVKIYSLGASAALHLRQNKFMHE